jgi:hypothetical protein
MKIFPIVLFLLILFSADASAQYSATKDAQYLAVMKAVSNYKINDEEEIDQIQKLRKSENFNRTLQKMMDKLDNSRTKDAKNRKILQILKKAGKEIYEILE